MIRWQSCSTQTMKMDFISIFNVWQDKLGILFSFCQFDWNENIYTRHYVHHICALKMLPLHVTWNWTNKYRQMDFENLQSNCNVCLFMYLRFSFGLVRFSSIILFGNSLLMDACDLLSMKHIVFGHKFFYYFSAFTTFK